MCPEVSGWWLTCEGERWGEEDMDACAVDVKHDAKVNGYAAQHCKAIDEGPVGGVERYLAKWSEGDQRSQYAINAKSSHMQLQSIHWYITYT